MNNSNNAMLDKARDVKKDLTDLGSMAVDAAKAGSGSIMDKAREAKSDLSDLGTQAVDAAHAKAAQIREGAMDVYEQGCAKAKVAQTTAEDYIKDEPLKSVLIAGAVGLAIGYILSRASSK